MRVQRHHHNRPGVFSGRGSRIYDRVARTLMRNLYSRIADDLVARCPTALRFSTWAPALECWCRNWPGAGPIFASSESISPRT